MNLTEKIKSIDGRVRALETKDTDTRKGIARIVKIYGNVKITATITAEMHDFIVPGAIYPGVFVP